MKKVINVTKTDIKKGIQGECETCPVALAVKRVFKDAASVSVYSRIWVYFMQNGVMTESYRAMAPKKVMDFIHKFDAYALRATAAKNCKPFSFTVNFEKV